MQPNWDGKYLTQMGYFSHINVGPKVTHSGETSDLSEMSHFIKTAPQYPARKLYRSSHRRCSIKKAIRDATLLKRDSQ